MVIKKNNKFIHYAEMWKKWAYIIVLTLMICSINAIQAQSLQQNSAFLIQKVEPFSHTFFIPLKYGLTLPYFYGFYVVDEETLKDFIEKDSVNYKQAIMLCDPANVMFVDSAMREEIKYFTRIMDILRLDDSEIYIIGNETYIIRRIEYAYYDNSQVKVYVRGYNHYMWDDLQEEDLEEYYKVYEVGKLYERNYYQCYHHLIKTLPTPEYLTHHIWKRLYQLGDKEGIRIHKIIRNHIAE